MLVRRGLALIACVLWSATAAAQARPGPTLAFGGDVLYDSPLNYQLRHRARQVGREEAYREVFQDLAPTISRADYTVVNLEVPVSPRYRGRSAAEGDVPVFRAPTHFLDALRAAGVDALTVANNHAYDQGLRGLRNTVAAARERDLPLIGVGADRASAASAFIVPVGGARVAFAAWTEGSNHRPAGIEGASPRIAFLRDETVQASLHAARAGGAHLVVAVFHWVHEDLVRPRPSMREAAREAAEAGADLVIGHGTHVPGSTETIVTSDGRRVRVLYSLGNLLAAMEEPAGDLTARQVGVRDAPLALVTTRWRDRRLEVAGVEVVHHWISRPITAAPWLDGGAMPVGRPVSIRTELERLARTPCGRPCDERAAQYRRRVSLIDGAMADLGPSLAPPLVASAPPPRLEPPVVAMVTPTRPEPPIVASAPPPRPEPPIVAAVTPTRPEPEPEGETHRRNPRVVIPDTDARLQPFLRGVLFPIEFAEDAVVESSVEDPALARLVALMVEDRGLHCEITGYSTAAEAVDRPSLGAMRARRVKVLIAGRGPSRSRFTTRGGRAGEGRRTGTAHVVVRLTRR